MTQRPEKPASIEERLKDYETKNAQSKSDADQGLIELKKQRDAATDPETKKALTDALKQYEETQKQMQEQMQTPEMKNMMAQMDSLQREQFKVDFQVENEKYNADSVA